MKYPKKIIKNITTPYDRGIDTKNFNFLISDKVPTKSSSLTFNKTKSPDLFEKLISITKNDEFYNEIVVVKVSLMYPFYVQFKTEYDSGCKQLEDLVKLLEYVYSVQLKNVKQMIKDKMITFLELDKLFLPGVRIVGSTTFGEKVGAIIEKTCYRKGGFHTFFDIVAKTNYTNGSSFVKKTVEFSIVEFVGLTNFSDLSVKIMDSSYCKELTERGKIFAKYAIGNHYKQYNANMFVNTYIGPMLFNGVGRIMIDVIGYANKNPNSHLYYDDDVTSHISTTLPEDELCMTWPFLPAFSLQVKKWGEIFLKHISEIKFDDNAFDLLVMDKEKKKLAKILVTNARYGFTDIISDKSGGCIFLLHGPPGTGKTLTTESISELLHMPLYSVTSGELGISLGEIEKTLEKILSLAQAWNAIILLDEADIFLQQRNNTDITRNAIVSIFLRLLERYKGIMFLTTNRHTEIDDAFKSRITITFEYNDLAYYDRAQIWKNLLSATSITLSDECIDYLAKININGRIIKNIIRLSHTLAIYENVPANDDHFRQIVSIMRLNAT